MFFILAGRTSAFLTCEHREEMSSIQKIHLNYVGREQQSELKLIKHYTALHRA